MKKILAVMVIALLTLPGLSFAKRVRYQVVDVQDGGTIKGTVISAKKVEDPVLPIIVKPKANPEETEMEKKTCGDIQKAMMYVMSPSNGVKNALVVVENVKKGKAAPKEDYVIDNLNCRFEPLVGISYVKANYVIKNSDPILHNTSLGKMIRKGVRRTVYNLALPHKDQVIEKRNRVSGLINVKCDAHYWMRAYVYSAKHPYVTITDEKGNFEIKDLLPGTYKIRFWHEGFEDIVREIEVKAGDATDVKVTFEKTRKPAFMNRVEEAGS